MHVGFSFFVWFRLWDDSIWNIIPFRKTVKKKPQTNKQPFVQK